MFLQTLWQSKALLHSSRVLKVNQKLEIVGHINFDVVVFGHKRGLSLMGGWFRSYVNKIWRAMNSLNMDE